MLNNSEIAVLKIIRNCEN